MKIKIILFLLVSCSLMAQNLLAPSSEMERIKSLAIQLERNAIVNRVNQSLFSGYPVANYYFRGRAEAYEEAAKLLRGELELNMFMEK